MPLFASISGYLYGIQLKEYDKKELIARKVVSMIPPILSWGIISTLFHGSFYVLNHQGIQIVDMYLSQIFGSWWFIWGSIILFIHCCFFYYNNLPGWLYP